LGLKLVVFLHAALKQRALQDLLQAGLPGIGVTAVGRIADFDRALREAPDAVLTLPIVLDAQRLVAKLRGQRQGAADEKYCLVAADRAPEAGRVGAVGALDLLGREGTTGFVHKLLGAKPKVDRVIKVEDLLPLLQMQRVQAVLLPARLFSEVQGMSRLKLFQSELAARVGLPAVAAVGPGAGQIMGGVTRLPQSTSRILGVDEWR
jgi:hypothetical protein